MVHTLILGVSLTLLGAATIYSLLVLFAALHFARRRPPAAITPPVSVFKPVHGEGSDLYDCLASFCRQDYPDFELLCCVADQDSPAAGVVRQLQQDSPQLAIRLLVADRAYGANPKIDSLDKMYREMRHAYMVISDDDILAGPDYLRRVMCEFADPQVGVVTCPYRGRPGGTIASLFEAVGISGEFFCGVMMARLLEGITFGLGSTIATRKELVEAIGGFPPLADYLADDYELGNRIVRLGHRAVLSPYVVDTMLPPDTWTSMFEHQFRWMRAQASSRPGGHFGLIVTYGAVFALAALALAPLSPLVWLICALWLMMRLTAAWMTGVVALNDPVIRRYWFLIPIREVLTATLWAASLVFRRITWRGRHYRTVGGKMVPIPRKMPPQIKTDAHR